MGHNWFCPTLAIILKLVNPVPFTTNGYLLLDSNERDHFMVHIYFPGVSHSVCESICFLSQKVISFCELLLIPLLLKSLIRINIDNHLTL